MAAYTGFLRIECEKRGDKTVVKDLFAQGAFKIARNIDLNDSGEACLYVMNPGGGYVDGDLYRTELTVEPNAEVLFTTQSSTKIYKTIKKPVHSEMAIVLKQGSSLEYLPDPIIAYQYARFKQKTVIRMEQGASFLCHDIYTPGWSPDGSYFQYDFIQSRMEVYQDERLVLFDHLKLQPSHGNDMREIGGLEGYTHYGSMIVVDDLVDSHFIDQLYESFPSTFFSARIGLSLQPIAGMALRVLAYRTQDIEAIFQHCHRLYRERKRNKEAVFLRKY